MAETKTRHWYVSRPSLLLGIVLSVLVLNIVHFSSTYAVTAVLLSLPMTHGLGLYCDCHNQS